MQKVPQIIRSIESQLLPHESENDSPLSTQLWSYCQIEDTGEMIGCDDQELNMLGLILLIRRLKVYPMTNGFVQTIAELKAAKEKNSDL